MASINITIQMDEDIKRQADELFSDLGLNLSSAINVFVKQSLRAQAIPFTLSRNMPNLETIEAIEEVKHMKKDPGKKVYDSFKDFMKEMQETEDEEI